jgi:hypothetical protein
MWGLIRRREKIDETGRILGEGEEVEELIT